MKYFNKSVLLSAFILSSVINSGCTTTQQKHAIDGQQIAIERKATNRAYVDQIKLINNGNNVTVSGIATIQTNTRGPVAGNLYVDLVDQDDQTIKQISKPYNRTSSAVSHPKKGNIRSKRRFSFNLDLGEVPKNVQKAVIYYAD